MRKGQRVLVVDDLLATGGTMAATLRLLERLGATVVGATFLIELAFLKGAARLRRPPDRLPDRLRLGGRKWLYDGGREAIHDRARMAGSRW